MRTGRGLCAGLVVGVSFDPKQQAVLAVTGDLDLVSAPQLAAVLDGVIGQGSIHVILDLAELSFMSAAGLRVIASGAALLRPLGGDLTVRSPSPLVIRLLDITGLRTVVRLERRDLLLVRGGSDRPSDGIVPTATEQLARYLQLTAIAPAGHDFIDSALRLVVGLAQINIPGADGVSVSLNRHGQLVTVAASDQTVLEMDAEQYASGEGPCVEAAAHGQRVRSVSLESETRWPIFTPKATELGISAILSSPLVPGLLPVGALNIYSRTPTVFGPAEEEMVSTFATHTSTLLGDAGVEVSDSQLSARLEDALVLREVIAVAQGIAMERERLSGPEAFTSLRRSALARGQTLRDLAEEVVTSTRRPRSPRFGVIEDSGD